MRPGPCEQLQGPSPFPHHTEAGEGGRRAWLTCQGWQLGMQMGVGQRLNVPRGVCRHLTEAKQGQAGCWAEALEPPL